jgi:hypothetical protein
MNVERLIATLPGKTDAERRIIRKRAMDWADNGLDTEKTAARHVLEALAKLIEREARADPVSKVKRAFEAIPVSDSERALIQVLLDNPATTSTRLTEAMGWSDKAWQLHFGKIGWDRQEYLWPASWVEKRNAPFKAGILADYDDHNHGFTMKPEVVAGLERVGIAPKRP